MFSGTSKIKNENPDDFATYLAKRQPGERFVDTARRLGLSPFRSASDAVRRTTDPKAARVAA